MPIKKDVTSQSQITYPQGGMMMVGGYFLSGS